VGCRSANCQHAAQHVKYLQQQLGLLSGPCWCGSTLLLHLRPEMQEHKGRQAIHKALLLSCACTGCRGTHDSCASGTRSCQHEAARIQLMTTRAIESSPCLHRSHLLSCSCISSGYLRKDFRSGRRRLAVAHLMIARWLAIRCCRKATGLATCRLTCQQPK